MKKLILLVSALMIVLVGCSGATDGKWPSKIYTENYTVEYLEVQDMNNYSNFIHLEYDEIAVSDIVKDASLIARLQIISQPVQYKITYKIQHTPESEITDMVVYVVAYEAKAINVLYSKDGIKNGDIFKFTREEYVVRNEIKHYAGEFVPIKKDSQYILFLVDNEYVDSEYERISTKAKIMKATYPLAIKEIANYSCVSFFRDIIVCNENTYEFDTNFSTLGCNAESVNNTIFLNDSIISYRITDSSFEQKMDDFIESIKSKKEEEQ